MTPTGTTTDLDDLATALELQRTAAGREVLSAAFAAPSTGVTEAERVGITAAAFGPRDHVLIWLALDVARAHPVATICKVARRALQAECLWDPRGAIGAGPLWNDESLALLATSYPRGTTTLAAIRTYGRELVALSRRWAAAESLLRQFRDTLTGAAEPTMIVSPARRLPVIGVTFKGKRGAA